MISKGEKTGMVRKLPILNWVKFQLLCGLFFLIFSNAIFSQVPVPENPTVPPVLGQPMQVPLGNVGVPSPAGQRSPLDPLPLEPVPPPIFSSPKVIENDYLRDAGVYGAVKPNPVLFFTFEDGFLKPSLKNNLQSTAFFSPGSAVSIPVHVNVPSTDLDWGFNFKIEGGYRLPDVLGAFALSYRNFSAEGNGEELLFSTPATVKTRVTINIGDLDYIAAPFQFTQRIDGQYRIGARLAGVFFDSVQQNNRFAQHESNYMFGGGPHFYVEGAHRFSSAPSLAAFAGLDTAVILGQVTQKFTAKVNVKQTTEEAYSQQFKIISVPAVNFQTGLSYTPPGASYMKFSTGFQLEYWWDLGNIFDSTASLGDLGFFFRGQVDF